MRVVSGVEALCDKLDTTPDTIRALARNGCPIVVIGKGRGRRYMADLDAVEAWFKAPREGKAAQ